MCGFLAHSLAVYRNCVRLWQTGRSLFLSPSLLRTVWNHSLITCTKNATKRWRLTCCRHSPFNTQTDTHCYYQDNIHVLSIRISYDIKIIKKHSRFFSLIATCCSTSSLNEHTMWWFVTAGRIVTVIWTGSHAFTTHVAVHVVMNGWSVYPITSQRQIHLFVAHVYRHKYVNRQQQYCKHMMIFSYQTGTVWQILIRPYGFEHE